MTEPDFLEQAANRSELAAARALARRAGVTRAAALTTILTERAGAAGLEALLVSRAALRAEEGARLLARRASAAHKHALQRARHAGAPSAWRGWFDGSARPNPGRCGIGVRLTGPAGELIELSQAVGWGDSSAAEYLALIALLETALAQRAGDLVIHGDSRVVLDDLACCSGPGALALAPYRTRAQALLAQLPGARLHWVPRHKNPHADALAHSATTSPIPEPDASIPA